MNVRLSQLEEKQNQKLQNQVAKSRWRRTPTLTGTHMICAVGSRHTGYDCRAKRRKTLGAGGEL